MSKPPRTYRVALRVAIFPLRHPAVWAWPGAVWLMLYPSHRPAGVELVAVNYYMAALGLVLLGCLPSFVTTRPPRPQQPPATFVPRRVLGWLTAAVLLFAAVVRLWRVWEWPPHGIGFEEFQIAARGNLGPNWAQNFLTLYRQPGEHTLTAYAISVSFAFLGTGFLAMRLPFIIASILCPILLYAVCRKLVAWEVSLFAVALFAVSWWQIAAGRVADEIFFPAWTELAILWLLLHFEDTGRTWAAFSLAVLSGLLIYEYTSYHLVPIVVVGYLLARVLLFALRLLRAPDPVLGARRQLTAALRTYAPGAVAMILVWSIIAHFQLLNEVQGGLSWFSGGVGAHASDPDGLVVQLSSPGNLPAFLARKLAVPVQAAYSSGHGELCRYIGIGGDAAFDQATAIAMAVGFVLVAMTFWWRFHAFVLIWAGLVICGAALLPANPNLHRYYVGLPLFYLIIALGADVLWRRLRGPVARYALLGVFAATTAYAATDNLYHVFWQLLPDQTIRSHWIWPRTAVIEWIRAHQRSDWICVVANDDLTIYGPNPLQPEWKFLVQGWNVRVSGSGSDCIPAPEVGREARYYIFALPNSPIDLEALLRANYPDAEELAPIEVPAHQFTARAFYVPPRAG